MEKVRGTFRTIIARKKFRQRLLEKFHSTESMTFPTSSSSSHLPIPSNMRIHNSLVPTIVVEPMDWDIQHEDERPYFDGYKSNGTTPDGTLSREYSSASRTSRASGMTST